jgi:elongation factor G
MAKKSKDSGLSVPLDLVRNIGVAAHIDAGTTTLTERILFYTGASHKIGEVHDGAATMDFMAEERAHGITIGSAVTQCPWSDHLIQVVDTPGHVDFTIEVERAMRVLDGAVIVMDGVRGVEPQTETVWRQASQFEIPRVVFVNKMDRPGADIRRSMTTIERRLGGHPVPVCVPIVDENTVMDLIHGELISFSGDRGETVTRGPIPAHLEADYEEFRETMLLACAEEDPELEDMVLEEADIPPERIISALRAGTMAGRMHPIFGGSALRNWGIQPLLDGVLALLPNPLQRPPAMARNVKTEEEHLIEMTPEGGLVALAFKVQLWDGRRHVFVRIYRGKLEPGQQVLLCGRDQKERVARVFEVNAGNKARATGATAGQIVLLAGLRNATTGDTLVDIESAEILLERIDTKEPVLGLAIEAASASEEEKLLDVLGKICEEDPTVRFVEDKDTGERVLRGMGELHLQIIFERIEREYGLKVRAGRPTVMTRETVGSAGKGNALVDRVLHMGENLVPLKARCVAHVQPRDRDAGMATDVNPRVLPEGSSLNDAQLEAVKAGVSDATMAGPSEGAPLQDVDVKLTEVELYAEGSTPQALRIAASQAVREALGRGGGQVLRPLMKVEVVVPDENLGSVLGDLQSKGANITGQESDMGTSTILCEAGLHRLLGYTTTLRSMTRGRGQFTMAFDRFDIG